MSQTVIEPEPPLFDSFEHPQQTTNHRQPVPFQVPPKSNALVDAFAADDDDAEGLIDAISPDAGFEAIRPAETMPLEALLEALDVPREERPRRDLRPDWLRDMIDCISGMFEPLAHTGRVGFECQPQNGRWHVAFYLGAAEHIGGALDGHVEAINFRFDLGSLMKCFERVDQCDWRVFPTPEAIGKGDAARDDIPRGLSSIVVEGVAMTGNGMVEPVSVEVHSLPPAASDVGLKLFADGDVAKN